MCQRCIELEKFKDDMLFELFRGDYLAGHRCSNMSSLAVDITSIREEWMNTMRSAWHLKTNHELRERLQSLVNLEVEFFSKLEVVPNCENFIKERPDVLVNRIVHHIQYLFNIKSIDKLLPSMNSLFLFTEEMKNFLASIRAIFHCDSQLPSSVLIDRTLKMLADHVVRH
jgi:hypothetical protein